MKEVVKRLTLSNASRPWEVEKIGGGSLVIFQATHAHTGEKLQIALPREDMDRIVKYSP